MSTTYAPPTYSQEAVKSKQGWLPSAILLAIVFVSFRPFATEVAEVGVKSGGGDIVNQLGFGLIGIACFWLIKNNVSQHALKAFNRPSWYLVLGVLVVSILSADNPSGAARAMIFSLIVVLAAVTVVALPRSKEDMISCFTVGIGTALAFCWFAVLFVPEQGIHGAGGFEAQHEGLWRGVFDHKNVASYVMGVFVMFGLFTMRNGHPFWGGIISVFSIIFVVYAGSKTVLGVLPVAIATVFCARLISFRPLKAFIILLPVIGLTTATLGAVIIEPILTTLQFYIPGLSYTGRTDLWIFGLEHLNKSPLFGYGFESFWGTQRVSNLEQPIELAWDVRGIVHGHNSWLDAAVNFGIPGAAIIIFVLTLLPVIDFLRIPKGGTAERLGGLYISIWVFTAMGANLESFFFRRADPVWFCMLIAIVGLRFTAHMTKGQRQSR